MWKILNISVSLTGDTPEGGHCQTAASRGAVALWAVEWEVHCVGKFISHQGRLFRRALYALQIWEMRSTFHKWKKCIAKFHFHSDNYSCRSTNPSFTSTFSQLLYQVKTESAKFILQMFWLILPCAAFLLVRRVYILKSDWTLRRQDHFGSSDTSLILLIFLSPLLTSCHLYL